METIKKRIVNYLDNHPRWFRKAELIEIAVKAGMNGDTIAREARRAFEEGLIQAEDYMQKNGQTATQYASLKVNKPEKKKVVLVEIDGVMVAQLQ